MFKTMQSSLDLKKTPTLSEIQKISGWVWCRWLSGSPYTIQVANQFNQYDIPIENQYSVVKSAFGGKLKYIPYPKTIKADESKELKYLANHFKVSMSLAKEYQEIDPKGTKVIIDMYVEEELR